MRHALNRRVPLPKAAHIKFAFAALLVLLLLGPALPGVVAVIYRPPGARRSSADAARRMLVLSRAYYGNATLAVPPKFTSQAVRSASKGAVRFRDQWIGCVRTGDQLLTLVMNDKTGDLIYAFNAAEFPPIPSSGGAPVDTPVQAARVSIQVAMRLQMVPPQSEVALAAAPSRTPLGDTWRVRWRVRAAEGASPYAVTIVLDRYDGHLLSLANSARAGDFIDR